MIHNNFQNFPNEQVKAYGSENTSMRWFRKPQESSHFMLRRFEIGPNGHIGVHKHPEEHQIYILNGPILLIDEYGDSTQVEKDEFIYCPSEEPHGYRNPNDFPVAFLCGIPKLNKE